MIGYPGLKAGIISIGLPTQTGRGLNTQIRKSNHPNDQFPCII